MDAAIQHADAAGLEALTTRQLAKLLDAAPMALYRHISSRTDLIDAIIDIVFSEIALSLDGVGWEQSMRQRALSLRCRRQGDHGQEDVELVDVVAEDAAANSPSGTKWHRCAEPNY